MYPRALQILVFQPVQLWPFNSLNTEHCHKIILPGTVLGSMCFLLSFVGGGNLLVIMFPPDLSR